MKTFAQRKMQKIKEELKKGAEAQKRLKNHIRENKEAYGETNSEEERKMYIKLNAEHRRDIQDSKPNLTALHQEYNRLKGKKNSHDCGFLVQPLTALDKFEEESFVVHLDYDSFEIAETTHVMQHGFLARGEKIKNENTLLATKNREEAEAFLEKIEKRVEGTPEMEEMRRTIETILSEKDGYEKRKKRLEAEIKRLKDEFDEGEAEGIERRLELNTKKSRLMSEMKNIKTDILEEYKNADK